MGEWADPADWGDAPTPRETLEAVERMNGVPWSSSAPECRLCGAFLGPDGDHADGSARCTSIEYHGGILVESVGAELDALSGLLGKVQDVVGEPEPKAKRSWWRGGGGSQVAKPPSFKRFGIGNR